MLGTMLKNNGLCLQNIIFIIRFIVVDINAICMSLINQGIFVVIAKHLEI